MFLDEKKEGSRMWALVAIVAALVFWFWLSREQSSPEESADEALKSAENIKKRVEIKSDPEPSEAKQSLKNEPKPEVPAPKTEPKPEIAIPKAEPKPEVPAPKTEPKPEIPAPKTVPKAKKAKAEPDDLTRIEGIGPKYAEILIAAGVDSYAKLAAMSADAIGEIIKQGGGRKAASITTWAEQAALAAAGDWEALEKLQASLSGGRK